MNKKQEGFKKLGLIVAAGVLAGACSPLAPSVSKLSSAASQKTTPTDSLATTALSTSASGNSLVAASRVLTLSTGGSQSTLSATAAQYQSNWSMQVDMKPEIDLKGNLRALSDFKSSGTAKFPISDDMKPRADALLSKNTNIFLIVTENDDGTTTGVIPSGLQATLSVVPAEGDEPAQWQLALVRPNTGDPVSDVSDEKQNQQALQDHLLDVVIEFDGD